MMTRSTFKALALAFAGTMALPSSALAQQSPVVVELYTSQGCSSCPPADALMHDLAKQDDVIALALHVDYWDYIGWKDVFAKPAHTTRQKAYATAGDRRMIYTPQMIVNGVDNVVGSHPMDLADMIRKHAAKSQPVAVTLVRGGKGVRISAPKISAPKPMVVQLVRYSPKQTVDIKRGENAGKKIDYVNIVTEWNTVAEWDGRAPLSMDVAAAGKEPIVVVIQNKGHGAIVGAARLH